MLRVRPALFCVYASFMLLLACQHPTRKQTVQRPVLSETPIQPDENTFESVPDLQSFYQGNQFFHAQHFDVSSGKKEVVVAKNGLRVTVDPASLEHADGLSPKGDIHVTIVELQNSNDLFVHNAASVSDGRLLMSGGSYYIGMSEGGKELRVRRGYSIETIFPRMADQEMELFYGERDSLSDMNWKRAGQYLRRDISSESISFDDGETYTPGWRSQTEVKMLEPAFNRKVFRTLKEPVFYYNRRMTIAELLDTINARKLVLCLDSISFWPKDLPTNVRLDTNYLIHHYGPRFQYIINRCELREVVKKDSAIQKPKEEGPVFYESVKTDTLKPRRITEQLLESYAPVGIRSLGWINVDRFYKISKPVDMNVDLPITFQRSRITYFILFKGFSGLLKGNTIPDDAGICRLMTLPAGEQIRLIAFIKKDGQVYQSVSDHETGVGKRPALSFKEISMTDLNKIFGKNIRT